MSDRPLMKCGCVAQGEITAPGPTRPVCVIHDCDVPADVQPDLTGRTASCSLCDNQAPSSLDLAFFEYHPDWNTDRFYCGCRGFD